MSDLAPLRLKSLLQPLSRQLPMRRLPDSVAELLLDLVHADDATFQDCVRFFDTHPVLANTLFGCIENVPSEVSLVTLDELTDRAIALLPQDVESRVDDACESLFDFMPERDLPLSVDVIVHPATSTQVRRTTATVRFKSPRVPMAIAWDRVNIEEDLSPFLIGLVWRGWIASIRLDVEASNEWKPTPLFRYHPERFRASRRYSKQMRSAIAEIETDPAKGLNEFMGLVMRELHVRINEVTRRAKLERDVQPMIILDAEEKLAFAWHSYVVSGRQIFETPQRMVAMLKHTDVDDVPVDMIKHPYPCYYVQFSPQADMELEPGWFVDGVYVLHDPREKLTVFTFTSAPSLPRDVEAWHAFGEPMTRLVLTPDLAGMDLATAVDHALSTYLQQLGEEKAQGDQDITDLGQQVAEETGAELPFKQVVTVTGTRATKQIESAHRHKPVMRRALQLTVNCLCYLTAYPDDVTPVWPDGTPPALRLKAEGGSNEERARAKNKLESMGYVQVQLCGTRLAEQPPEIQLIDETRHMRSHWRRGHWRRQVYGEGRALRRIIWVMPVLVNSADATADDPGHVYRVQAVIGSASET